MIGYLEKSVKSDSVKFYPNDMFDSFNHLEVAFYDSPKLNVFIIQQP